MKIKSNEPKKEVAELFKNTVVKKIEVNDELKKSFYSYAMAVNVSRAIPDVRDGLKPVHRRILYAMGELNNFYDKPYKKIYARGFLSTLGGFSLRFLWIAISAKASYGGNL